MNEILLGFKNIADGLRTKDALRNLGYNTRIATCSREVHRALETSSRTEITGIVLDSDCIIHASSDTQRVLNLLNRLETPRIPLVVYMKQPLTDIRNQKFRRLLGECDYIIEDPATPEAIDAAFKSLIPLGK